MPISELLVILRVYAVRISPASEKATSKPVISGLPSEPWRSIHSTESIVVGSVHWQEVEGSHLEVAKKDHQS